MKNDVILEEFMSVNEERVRGMPTEI